MTEEQQNPFKAIARLLQAVRETLESPKKSGQAPRWVRIARIREFSADGDFIANGVRMAINGFSTAIMYMNALILEAKDLLVQSDAAKALVEVSAEFIKTATSDAFINDLKQIVGQPPGGNPLGGVGSVVDNVVQIADKVPEPDDLKIIGAELYRLLCLEQLPLSETGLGKTTETHLDMLNTGKLRLLNFALDKPLALKSLKSGTTTPELFRLGSRRVWLASAEQLPARTVGLWKPEGGEAETIYRFDFTGDQQGRDIAEANSLLANLGYTEPPAGSDPKVFDDSLARRLRRFQMLNEMPITGKLDNDTLNRLVHLDFVGKNLERAKRYDATKLPQGFDDSKDAALKP